MTTEKCARLGIYPILHILLKKVLQQKPGVVFDGLFASVSIVEEKLGLFLDVMLGDQYQSGSVAQHHHLKKFFIPTFQL